MHLCLVATRWHNAFNELTIRMADDLFACAAREGRNYDPFPKGGELVQVTLNVELVGSDRPHPVQSFLRILSRSRTRRTPPVFCRCSNGAAFARCCPQPISKSERARNDGHELHGLDTNYTNYTN